MAANSTVPRKRKSRTEDPQFTWFGINTIDLNKKTVKVNCDDGGSVWLDPFTSLTTAGAMERLVSYLKNLGREITIEAKLKQVEDWIQELESYQSRYEKKEEKDFAPEEEFAFCCYVCRCSQEEFGTACVRSSDDSLFHRYCCHKIKGVVGTDWKSDLDRAANRFQKIIEGQVANNLGNNKLLEASAVKKEAGLAWDEENKLHGRNDNAIATQMNWASRRKTEEKSVEEMKDKFCKLRSHPAYVHNCNEFLKVKTIRSIPSRLRKAVVLEMFGGVGTGTIALKKLGIAIKKVIFVETDKVAMHVMRHNHDSTYNNNQSDLGIEHHVEYPSFESVFQDIDSFMEQHGPIDIVIGGPPSLELSEVPPTEGQSVVAAQDTYLSKFADLIIRIKKEQGDHPLFYIVENLILDNLDDIERVNNALECPAIMLDAQYFSPARRKRHYWCNIELQNFDFQGPASCSSSASCLDYGWHNSATAWADGKKSYQLKANTFMASKDRLDDQPRMMKVKRNGLNKFEIGLFSVNERERMLGFPEGYVKSAVDHLYNELYWNGYEKQTTFGTPWRDTLDKKFHCFSGYPPRFVVTEKGISHKMLAYQIGNKHIFFGKDDYSKHLLGGAFSVPVLQYLLKPLACLFEHQQYDGYTYRFKWEQEDEVLQPQLKSEII